MKDYGKYSLRRDTILHLRSFNLTDADTLYEWLSQDVGFSELTDSERKLRQQMRRDCLNWVSSDSTIQDRIAHADAMYNWIIGET